ncbi:MAG TPA: hypothetical protein VFO58_13225 [Vicinamibacterales bacterium]|nr:hypothetical protein [Vicinamibacterales bacterium]
MSDAIDDRAGLCASCLHARAVTSSKGSTFVLCQLSLGDPRFARYPPLPMIQCEGYRRAETPRARVKSKRASARTRVTRRLK